MKKAIIGGFLSLICTIWLCTLYCTVMDHMVTEYFDPPGPFFSTVQALNLTIPMLLLFIGFIIGIIIMGREFFRKE